MIGADHPDRRRRLHRAARGKQPGAREIIVRGERRRLVPVVVDRIDMRFVGALEIALQLQIVQEGQQDQIDRSGIFDISATQSPMTICELGAFSN